MLFSSPDYPIFLIAVFFLYALMRGAGPGSVARIARAIVVVVLADLVFVLITKQVDGLWDPLGGALLRLAAGAGDDPIARSWPVAELALHWTIGSGVLAGAIWAGRNGAPWLASDRGQRVLARGLVLVLAAVGALVAIASDCGELDEVSAWIAAHGQLVLLVVIGIALGCAQRDAYRPLGRVLILFVASSLFYQAWAAAMPGPYRYLLALLLGTIALDYYLAIWIEATERPAARKALVVLSLCSNLGILFFFKYTDFAFQDVLHLPIKRLNLILPAGISFHTFQSLSYTIDVYRKKLRATRSVVTFATFVLFFPQLVAGPIVRAEDLLPQLESLPPLELEAATEGLFRIVVGLFKKIALADTLALVIVDRVFENPSRFSAVEVLAGVYGYALQIYLDFSAYSDIAIGSAQVLGFTLPENFRTPYRSANLQEFWRRWHISLSTWLRDYLYISLGGSRGAPWRTYVNLIATMILGGLWHGASWAFIVWGALHGFGLAVTRFFQRRTARNSRDAIVLIGACAAIATAGAIATTVTADALGVWPHLVIVWLTVCPLWAVLTAWLGSDERPRGAREPDASPAELGPYRTADRAADIPVRPLLGASLTTPGLRGPEALRLAMCVAGIALLCAMQRGDRALWIPFAVATWALGWAADAVARPASPRSRALRVLAWALVGTAITTALVGPTEMWPAVITAIGIATALSITAAGGVRAPVRGVLRGVAVVLVFHYVCLAWIFFRATSFDNALSVLQQIAGGEADHPNVVPIVMIALVVGFASHLFADGSFGWLRDRFVALPAPAKGLLLAGIALVLRALSHTQIVPFIYFQF